MKCIMKLIFQIGVRLLYESFIVTDEQEPRCVLFWSVLNYTMVYDQHRDKKKTLQQVDIYEYENM